MKQSKQKKKMANFTAVELRDYLLNDTNGNIDALYNMFDPLGDQTFSSASDWLDSLMPNVVAHVDYGSWDNAAAHEHAKNAAFDSWVKAFNTYMATTY